MRAIIFLAALSVSSHAQTVNRNATIEGSVKDVTGASIAAASVSLCTDHGDVAQHVFTDSQGHYRFGGLPPGSYNLRVSATRYQDAASAALIAGGDEKKVVDFALKRATSSTAPTSADMPEFSDEPNFTVAGVTDPTNLGGHGSDVVVRNREGLAKATVQLGGPLPAMPPALAPSEESLREAVERDPSSYETNYRLGTILVQEGKAREAISYLDHASQIKPASYQSQYELASAHYAAGDYEIAAQQTRALLARQDKAQLHHLMGEIEEKNNNPLQAVRQFQRAAELDPAESNYFDWGSELLLHEAPEPAIQVLLRGSRLFPASVRMLAGLGAAEYAHGSDDQAVETLCRAADLDPTSDIPYMFLSRIQDAERNANAEIAARLARFARLQPANAWANYYYAVSLWKQRRGPDDNSSLPQIKSLLENAVRIDPKLALAHLQLGNLYFEQKNFPSAIAAYQRATENSPDLPDAHYRLAQAYQQAGEKLKAQQELQRYQQSSNKAAEEVERQRHELRQFVYTLRDQTPAQVPQ